MTPKAVIDDAGETLELSNLGKPWYLHCSEHNNMPIPIPAYNSTVIKQERCSTQYPKSTGGGADGHL